MPQFVNGEATVQTVGLDFTRGAQRNTYRAIPSGVVYSLLFAPWPDEIWTPSAVQDQANLWEGYWNQNAAVPGVTGIATTQQTNEVTGNLEDVAFVGVKSTSGLSTSQITLTIFESLPENFPGHVAAERAALDAIEGAGSAAVAAE